MSLRLLITGANGQVGWHLQRTLAPLGEVQALTRTDLDIGNLDALTAAVRDSRADVVVNAAAYTAVDKAESEPEQARRLNLEAPARLAAELARTGGLLIHYSTDYVFDGAKHGPYDEDDPTAPLNVYGRTKLEGEQAIAASGCAHIILRTSWVYDIRGKNFLRTVLRLAQERDELRMVGDQIGAPTWARSIAGATAIIVAKTHHGDADLLSDSQSVNNIAIPEAAEGVAGELGGARSGVFHLTSAGETSWAGFAEAILEEYEFCCEWPASTGEYGSELKAKRVVHITSAQYKTAARRPLNSLLSNRKLATAYGISLPDWRSQLRLALQDAIR